MNQIRANVTRLSRHTLIYGLGNILNRTITFLLLPLYTNLMTTSEYGALNLIYPFMAFMNVVFMYGMDAAFMRFFIPEKDSGERRRVLGTIYSGILMTTLLWLVMLFVLKQPITTSLLGEDPSGSVFWLAFVILAIDGLSFIPVLYYRSIGNAPRYVAIIFIEVLVNLSLNVLFVGFWGWGIKGVLIANVVSSGIKLLLSLIGVIGKMELRWSWSRWKPMLAFGLPTMPAVAFALLTALSDRYILNYFFDREVVGVYAANYKIGTAMGLMVTAFRFAWHPFFLSISDQADARKTYARILSLYLAVGGLFVLTVALLAPPILTFEVGGRAILPGKYQAGLGVIPLVLLGYLLQGVYVNLVVGMYIEKKTKLAPLFTGTGVVLNLGLNFFLIGVCGWDFHASAVALVVANLGQALVCWAVSRRFYPVPYDLWSMGKVVVVLAVLYFLGAQLQGHWAWLRLFLVAAFLPLLDLLKVITLKNLPSMLRGLLRRGSA